MYISLCDNISQVLFYMTLCNIHCVFQEFTNYHCHYYHIHLKMACNYIDHQADSKELGEKTHTAKGYGKKGCLQNASAVRNSSSCLAFEIHVFVPAPFFSLSSASSCSRLRFFSFSSSKCFLPLSSHRSSASWSILKSNVAVLILLSLVVFFFSPVWYPYKQKMI